jgi:hypothetical protein
MLEQWFLDLDGVRSGPYQTSEVLSLVAEGEILPHHLISSELKSKEWKTILEWRLNQNKDEKPKPVVVSEPAPVQAPIQTTLSPEKTPEPVTVAAIELELPKAPKPLPDVSSSKSKRDPMAEMFDMLQNTKQKREQKSHQAHTQTKSSSTSSSSGSYPNLPEKSGSLGKIITVSIVVTILGFILGQLFQKQMTKEAKVDAPPKVASNPSPSPSPTPIISEKKLEVIDRSNEKITIRSHAPESTLKPQNIANEQPREREKDKEMLDDLKKELSELKALKEEIRNNNDGDNELPPANSKTDENGQEIAPGNASAGSSPNAPGSEENPNNGNQGEVHY